MFRFSIFTGSNTSTSASNPSSSNQKKDTVPMHDLDIGFKYDAPSYSKPAQKLVNNPTVNNTQNHYEHHFDYERGISFSTLKPW